MKEQKISDNQQVYLPFIEWRATMQLRKLIELMAGISIPFGGLMAQHQDNNPLSHEWFVIQDETSGLETAFPQHPLDITYDIPFNDPAKPGKLHLYSSPVPHGVLVSGILDAPSVTQEWLEKKNFKNFFETVVIPRLLYYPKVFREDQHFDMEKETDALHFQATYLDHDTIKKMMGIAKIKNHQLIFAFYLATADMFESDVFEHFIQSVHVSE